MKKLFVLVLIFVSVFVFSNTYVEDIDGNDWISWTVGQRTTYVQGFYSAYSSISTRMIDEFGPSSDQNILEDWFYINITVVDMVNHINIFYQPINNRRFRLFQVLMMLAGKDYWNN